MASAMSDRLSSEKPHRYITAQVPIRETGTATAGMNVAWRFRRKRKTTAITSITEIIKVRSMSETEARMVRVRSSIVTRCSPARNGGLERGHRGLYGVHRRDDVGSGLAENQHVDRRLAVQKSRLAHGLLRIDHIGDVLQPDRGAVVIADDQRLVIGGLRDLVVGDDIRGRRRRWRTGLWPRFEFWPATTCCTAGRLIP